jgi:hypothetical protein
VPGAAHFEVIVGVVVALLVDKKEMQFHKKKAPYPSISQLM